jgi:pimeloyl-ACP methyl ester carboxylesterase
MLSKAAMGVAALTFASAATSTIWAASAAEQGHGGYADVNGIRMYYETYGPERGVPLVLLHGGGSTIDVTWGRILPFLARDRRVIAIEEQAHGRTSDRKAPVGFETSADDVAGLLKHLKVEQADVFGFSNGASVGLQVAIRHPQAVRKLVFASSFTKREGAQPQLWEMIRTADIANMPQPLKDAFLKVNPDPAKLKTMHDKDAERMRHFTDVPNADLRAMHAPTLIVIGDHDIVKPEHALELTHLIPNSRLMILVGGHGDYLGEAIVTQRATRAPELTAGLVAEFLDAP